MQTFTIKIRPGRQITIPKKLLDELGIGVGDQLSAQVIDNKIILRPIKSATPKEAVKLLKL